MQSLDVNWMVFGLGLVAAFIFGMVYAVLVRLASNRNWDGQTAWSVVVGVTFTLLTMIPFAGGSRRARSATCLRPSWCSRLR
mgnify:CR=1 FL=1